MSTIRDDGLLLIFSSKLEPISLKQHQGQIGHLQQQINLLQGKFPEYQCLNNQ